MSSSSTDNDTIGQQKGQVNIKELAELYKAQGQKKLDVRSDPRMMTVILGGMLYDHSLCRGKRAKSIPQPNPRKVELRRSTSIREIYEKAKQLFFADFDEGVDNMDLVDSNGFLITLDMSTDFSLYNYYCDNKYSPSRHKLYVALDCSKGVSEESIFGDGEEQDSEVDSGPKVPEGVKDGTPKGAYDSTEDHIPKGYTLPQIVSCRECSKSFRTYIPGTDCLLPDGSLQCHQEPQETCPECSGGYGMHFNTDLFPHMTSYFHSPPVTRI